MTTTTVARPWSMTHPVGLGSTADMLDPTWPEFAAAVREQEPMVARLLGRHGRAADLDLVMGEVHSTAWLRLDRWRSLTPRPHLAAYINGIARNCVHEWRRRDMAKAGGSGEGSDEFAGDISDLPAAPSVQLDGTLGDLEPDEDDTLGEMAVALRTLHALVIARPGGCVAWQRIVTSALQDVRGEQLRTEIRLFLDSHIEGRTARLGPGLQRIMSAAARPSIPTQRTAS